MYDSEFIKRFRLQDTAFTRSRDLPFHRLVALMLNLRKGSTEQELGTFFSTLEEQPVATARVSAAAFCQARRKVSEAVFVALNRLALQAYRNGCGDRRWQGFRLLAVDGTTLRLPPGEALESAFGAQPSGPTLARASTLYALEDQLVIDTALAATCVGEHELAIKHLAAAGRGDLIVYDRGYPAFWLFALHRAKQIDFCMRMPRGGFAEVDAFFQSDEPSRLVTLSASPDQRRACGDQQVCADAIKLRLVRVRLKGGDTEVLATSVLDEQRIADRLFGELYRRRWGVEEGYKRLKCWAEIESISGRSLLAVRQDVHAKVLAFNLTSMLRNVAQCLADRRYAQRKHRYQVRGCSSLSAMKNNLVRLIIADPPDRQHLLEALLRQLATAVDAVREGRSFPRDNPGRRKTGPHMAYKRAA